MVESFSSARPAIPSWQSSVSLAPAMILGSPGRRVRRFVDRAGPGRVLTDSTPCVRRRCVAPREGPSGHSVSAMNQGRGGRRLCWACPGSVETGEGTDFGQLIRELRVSSGMSQRELGERIGTTQSAIARLETGDAQPKLGTLQKLAEAFDRDLHLYVRAPEPT